MDSVTDESPAADVPPTFALTTVSGREIPIEKTETIIGRGGPGAGRGADVDLVALGVPEEQTVSRRHCRVSLWEADVFLEDLGSTNGTRVNHLDLTPGKPVRLTPGDEIEVGGVRLVFGARGELPETRERPGRSRLAPSLQSTNPVQIRIV